MTMSCNVTSSVGTEVMWVDSDHGQVIHHLSHPVQEKDPLLYQSYSVSMTDLMSGKYNTNMLSQVSIHNI